MTWTAPKTWVANSVITAAELNEQIRDNLNHCAPPIVTGNAGYVVSEGENFLAFRKAVRSVNQEAGERSSTTYGDLSETTVGPSVTLETSNQCLVIWGCTMIQETTPGSSTFASVAVTGATTIAADDGYSERIQTDDNYRMCASQFQFFNTLTPGEHTFTMKYRVAGGNGRFLRRRIMALPL